MASLTDTLSDVSQGVKPVRQVGGFGSGAASAINAITKGIDMFGDFARSQQVRARQRAQDAAVHEDNAAYTDALQGIFRAQDAAAPVVGSGTYLGADGSTQQQLGVSNIGPLTLGESDFSDAAQADAKRGLGRIRATQAAVDQGKMPQISLNAAMEREFRTILNRHPESADKVLAAWKAAGVDSAPFRAALDEQKQHDAVRDQGISFEGKMFEVGAGTMGPTLLATQTREQVIAAGIAATKHDNDLKMLQAQAQLAQTNQSITKADRDAQKSDLDDRILSAFSVDAYNNANPIITSVQKLVDSIGKLSNPAEQQKQFELLAPQYEQMAANYKANALAKATAAGLRPEKLSALGNNIDAMIGRGRSLWSGQFSVASANTRAIQTMSQSLKIDASKALPVFSALQEIGLRPTEMMGVMDGINNNKSLQDSLRQEIEGYNKENNFGRPSASTHMMNIVRIMKGQSTLADMNPTEARSALPVLYKANQSNVAQFNAGADVSGDTVLHGVGNIIIAARTLTPSSGVDAWRAATAGFASRGSRIALVKLTKDPDTNDQAEATIIGSRAASAGILQQMATHVASLNDPYHKVVFDRKNGQYTIQTDNAAIDRDMGAANRPNFSIRDRMPAAVPRPGISAAMQQFVETANGNLTNITDLMPYDKTAPKMSPLEARLFYGAGVVPKHLKGTAEKPINVTQEVENQLAAVKKAFENIPNMNQNVQYNGGGDLSNVPFSAVRNKIVGKESGGNYNAVVYGESAPKPVTQMTIGEAYDYQRGDLRSKTRGRRGSEDIGSTGLGAYQFESKTLQAAAQRVYGDNWRNIQFTPDVQERLAEDLWHNVRGNRQLANNTWAAIGDL